MTVANSDQENKNQNTYYHPDPRLDGWTFMSISPVDSVSEPLLGKTIVNKKPEPKPITTEANTDSRKRSYDARFPFGQSQEIDALITKNNKKRPQTNLHTTNHDNSRSNATNALNTTQSSQGNTDSSRSMPQPSQETRRVLPESHNATLRGRVMPQSLNTTPSRIIAPKTLASVTRHITPKRNINDSKKTYSVFSPELYNTLSDEQKRIHDLIVNNKQSVFFSGSAGTGKSVLLRAIINTLKSKLGEGELAVTASTGIAALNIGGVTIQKFAHVNLGKDPVGILIKRIINTPNYVNDWLRVKVLIVDEISMIEGHFLDKLDEIARTVRRNQKVFGGIQLVLSGDFYQLPPVDKSGSGILAFESKCWPEMIQKSFILKACFRQKDKEFARMLNEIREGRVSDETERQFKALSRRPDTKTDIVPADLFPTRREVDNENFARLAKLPGETRVYIAKDHGNSQVLEHCIAPTRLILKVGAQVMLVKNIEKTLVNGLMGIVRGFSGQGDDKMPIVEFSDGTTMTITEKTWEFEQPRQPTTTRSQIPLTLAWAFTIHKSQGQTIEYVRVDLRNSFETGQAYVALSRATCMTQLQVLNFRKELVRAHPRVTEFYDRIDVDE